MVSIFPSSLCLRQTAYTHFPRNTEGVFVYLSLVFCHFDALFNNKAESLYYTLREPRHNGFIRTLDGVLELA